MYMQPYALHLPTQKNPRTSTLAVASASLRCRQATSRGSVMKNVQKTYQIKDTVTFYFTNVGFFPL